MFLLVFQISFIIANNDTFVSADSINNHIYVCNGFNASAAEGSSSTGSFGGIGELFSSADYNSIRSDDNNFVYDSSDVGMHQYHEFRFNIDENLEDITRIDITWKGYGGDALFNYGYSLWVMESGNYVNGASGTKSSKDTLVKSYTNLSDINVVINGGSLYIGVQSDYEGEARTNDPPFAGVASWIKSYYVEVNITYNAQGDEEQGLVVSNPISVVEMESFDVTVTSCGIPIENALVGFNGLNLSTNEFGVVSFSAPEVESDTSFDIFVYRAGYVVNVSSIAVLDNSSQDVPVLDISAPSSVFEGESFQVQISADDVAVEGVLVVFAGALFYTDESGIVIFTAPPVEEDITYAITASKSDYVSAESSILVLDDNASEQSQLDIVAPSSVFEGESFQVQVSADDNFVEDVKIIFSGYTYYTNINGIAIILAPSVDSNKSIKLSANKSGYLSDEIYVLVLNEDTAVVTPNLFINCQDSVYENNEFVVTVVSEGVVVSGVNVTFNGDLLVTNAAGKVVFTTPSVEYTRSYTVTASKTGYKSYSKSVNVIDELETSIVLIYPCGGEYLSGVVDVSWVVFNPPAVNIANPEQGFLLVDLSYRKDNGSWVLIAEGLDANIGFYSWDTTGIENYDKYFLKIVLSSSDDKWTDISDDTFSIYNAPEEVDGWIYGNISETDENVSFIQNVLVCIYMPSVIEKTIVNKCRYTNNQGAYSITCPSGIYIVKISKPGYETKTFYNINVESGQGTKLDFILNKTSSKSSKLSITEYIISEEIKKGIVGGMVDLRLEEKQISLYNDINIDVNSSDLTSEKGVELLISGEGQPGTKIIIYLGFVQDKDKIQVLYDGILIEKTNDFEAFFTEEKDFAQWVLTSSSVNDFEEQIVIVNIPHFSQHEITIKLTDFLTQINAVLYYVGFLVLVATMFLGIGFLRKKYY